MAESEIPKPGRMERALAAVERVGNKLPDPAVHFSQSGNQPIHWEFVCRAGSSLPYKGPLRSLTSKSGQATPQRSDFYGG